MSNELTTVEQQELAQHEAVIEHGLQTFYDVGKALLEIREGRLYRGHSSTFDDYCRSRWGMSRTNADDLIRAANTVNNLTEISVIPQNATQVRPLLPLEPDQQREVWQMAVESAPNGKITGAHVQQIVDEHLGKPFDYKRDAKANRAARLR